MINAVSINPFADPVSFFIFYFFFYVSTEGLPALLKLALMSSALVFPFALLGDWLFQRLLARTKARPLFLLYAASLLCCVAFWLVMLCLQVASGRSISGDIVLPLLGSSVVVFLLGLLGHYLFLKMRTFWKMPRVLGIYVVELAMCVLFWVLVWLYTTFAPALY